MRVPFDQAELTVHCMVHNRDVEYTGEMDSEHLLDRIQLYCPGLSDQVRYVHESINRLEAQALIACGIKYREEHPEEVALYPADWMPTNFTPDEYPSDIREQIIKLDQLEDEAADVCFASWVVILEAREHEQDHPN